MKWKPTWFWSIAVIGGALAGPVRAEESAPLPWQVDALARAPQVFDAPEAFNLSEAAAKLPAGVRAFCFEGLPFRGKPNRIFAFYGAPAGASPAAKVPGIVLVHGAGGTAFADWVKLWVDRGYAAIAFDHDGGMPVGKFSAWARNPDGSSLRRGDVIQLGRPIADQWMYHAVAESLLAHSLLASFPEVDAGRIGITGISWGGVIVATVAGVDPRLKFAVPVYGCGFISDETDDGSTFVGLKGTPEQRAAWRQLWDPANFLPRAKLPMLWVNGTNDFAFTPRAWQSSYRAAPGPRTLSLRLRMKHGHNGPGESPEEIRVFADSIVKGGPPLLRIVGQGGTGPAWVAYEAVRPLKRAELNFTRGTGRWQDREWETLPAQVKRGRVFAALPEGTTAYYFSLVDDRDLIVTSEQADVPPAVGAVQNSP